MNTRLENSKSSSGTQQLPDRIFKEKSWRLISLYSKELTTNLRTHSKSFLGLSKSYKSYIQASKENHRNFQNIQACSAHHWPADTGHDIEK